MGDDGSKALFFLGQIRLVLLVLGAFFTKVKQQFMIKIFNPLKVHKQMQRTNKQKLMQHANIPVTPGMS